MPSLQRGGRSVAKKRARIVAPPRQEQDVVAAWPRATSSTAPAADISVTAPAQSISGAGLPKINLQLSNVNVVGETPVAPTGAWSANQSQASGNNKRRLSMWTGVTISMVVIFAGWAWTLRYSLNVPANVSNDTLPLRQTEDSLTDLFQQVNRSLDKLQAEQPASANLSQPSSPPPSELNAGEIELLKRKLEERTRGQESEKAPAAVK
ncbi:hypothetical protein A3I40_00225 [Candidatus Uhrbacteria bacterium RIFCSPLOWO2_02_FULL_48_12]|uniref:Uncharacterized protein n=1 Tax=Candidatus Uhrbacteria bacterium RIFCSPLOWO2_02_FULL_48_12 TaxID=1802407 RepID=A0A1F7V8C7_9BACT|nr:MAG: hypothetical protein A3I40_00225 [Candidatus Uhrbacteria bacterium RIFCSPLOWO2_02_FULL_48_12]